MKHPKLTLVSLILIVLSSLCQAQENNNCVTTCKSYTTCSTCVGTCNSCSFTTVADPEYTNKLINNLPVEFRYSKEDLNPGNNSCTSTECGTKTCAGVTTDSNKTLPANWESGACTLTPSNSVPARLNCRWRDYYCGTHCAKWETYSCCETYETTCEDESI